MVPHILTNGSPYQAIVLPRPDVNWGQARPSSLLCLAFYLEHFQRVLTPAGDRVAVTEASWRFQGSPWPPLTHALADAVNDARHDDKSCGSREFPSLEGRQHPNNDGRCRQRHE